MEMIKMISLIHIPSGITLFSRVFDKFCERIGKGLSYDLIGCFIKAFKVFSQELEQEDIKLLEMSSLKFICCSEQTVLIFFVLDESDNTTAYGKTLKIALNTFLMLFKKEIQFHPNNTALFQTYNSVLNELLKIPHDQIEPSCLNCTMGIKKNCIFSQVKEKILKINENKKNTKK
jgi:hypothetical protein